MLKNRLKFHFKTQLRCILFASLLVCIVNGQTKPTRERVIKPATTNNDNSYDRQTNAKSISMRVGEGVNFSTGKVTKFVNEADMAFKYLPPQSPHGMNYNLSTGQFEYQARVSTNQNYPLLEANNTASYKTKPDITQLTVGDVNTWTGDEYYIEPGRYVIVRGKTDGEHYLIKIHKLTATNNNPKTWTIAFSYEPIKIALGAPKTAGRNFPLSGTLTYLERIGSKKIIDLDLATGNVVERFDGHGVSRSQKGEYAYVDQAGRIIIANAETQTIATLKAPSGESETYGMMGPIEVAISPNGDYIAAQINRSEIIKSDFGSTQGIALPTVAVLNRAGKEVAAFHRKKGATWTPDNRLIVTEFFDPGLYTTDAGFRRLQPVPNTPDIKQMNHPTVAPNGKTIAFAANERVWLINLDGTGLRQLTNSGLSERAPVWSPDGQFIAIQQSDPTTASLYRIVVTRLSDGKSLIVTDKHGSTRAPDERMSWR